MFVCDFCSKPCGPRIKPRIVVFETRDREYTNARIGEEGEETFVTRGTETVVEFKQCPNCYPPGTSKPPVEGRIPNYMGFKVYVRGIMGHARGCNKTWGECKICQGVATYMRQFPPQALAAALEDVRAQPARFTLGGSVVGSMFARTFDASQRAKRDFEAAYPILKAYEERGGTA